MNQNMKEHAMLFKDEKVESILEYSKDKMIISVYPTDLFIVHNWSIVK